MATSSIIENIRVNNPQLLVEYLEAIKRWGEYPDDPTPRTHVVHDPEVIRSIADKALARIEAEKCQSR